MSTTTPNLGLFKYNTTTDANVAFNINTALNQNWDIIDAAITGGSSRNIGEIVASTLPLTDAGLHLLDGALISGSGSYSEFVQYIANLYTNNPTANYFTDETTWQDAVTSYGVCGKFVYDSINNTVRLPKITGILEGTTDLTALGDLVEAGLPNITGNISQLAHFNTYGADGVFKNSAWRIQEWGWAGGNGFPATRINFNATNSSSIYGNSSTVQPQTIKAFYYIVIATSSKTDIQVDIDEIATDLNGKADTDLSNVPNDRGILRNSYVSGVIGYRKYSDGFMEAWGTYNGATGATITLPITFSNMNYCLTTANFEGYCIYAKVSVSSISWHDKNVANPTGICWYVCGY